MRRYLRIYLQLARLNLAMLFAFRATFLNNLTSSTLWSLFPILTIYLLTSKSKSFYSWSGDDLYLLTAYFTFFLGLFYTIFGRSFKRFSRLVEFGQLDAILLKPVDSQFLISFWHINFTNLTRMILGLVLVVHFSIKMHIPFSWGLIGSVLLFTVASMVLLYSIWFGVLTVTVWMGQLSNLRDLLLTSNTIMRYPPELLQYSLLLLVFLPLTLVVVTPTKILLHRASFYDILLLYCVSAAFFIFSRLFWKFALRYHTSEGG